MAAHRDFGGRLHGAVAAAAVPGFHNDVAAFEAWTLTLQNNPPWQFYAKTSFADYPPGYFIVLWVLGGIYGLIGHLHLINTNDPSYFALRLLVKLPALVMDLVDAALIYAIVRRYASEAVALGAAALFALNPTTIYVSAYWGQIDSVSWGFVLLALWLALRSSDVPAKLTARLTWAWLAIAFSILIKPQGALVAVVLVAFAFAPLDASLRRLRLRATAIGLGALRDLGAGCLGALPPLGESARIAGLAVRALPHRQRRLCLQHRQRLQPLRDQADVLAVGFGRAAALRRQPRSDVAVGPGAGRRRERADRRTLLARTHRPRVPRSRDAGGVRVLHAGHAHARALHLRRVSARLSATGFRPAPVVDRGHPLTDHAR